jgi:hypothetical protein
MTLIVLSFAVLNENHHGDEKGQCACSIVRHDQVLHTMHGSNLPSIPRTIAATMACFVMMGACCSGILSAAPALPFISDSALDRGGGGGGGRDTEAVGEACFCLSLWTPLPGGDVVVGRAGRVIVAKVVPVLKGKDILLAPVVTCNAGMAAAVLDTEGAVVGSGPRVWTGRDGAPLSFKDEAPLFFGDGGSSSSSDSESSLSDDPPTVEGLLNGESGLSGPSSLTGIVVAVPS